MQVANLIRAIWAAVWQTPLALFPYIHSIRQCFSNIFSRHLSILRAT
jgi:hypothetical protein